MAEQVWQISRLALRSADGTQGEVVWNVSGWEAWANTIGHIKTFPHSQMGAACVAVERAIKRRKRDGKWFTK